MKRAVLAAGAILALALSVIAPTAVAATSLNGAKFDPQNLIDDQLETEALSAYARHAARRPFKGDEIVIVDYALPSTAKRLYIANIRTGTVEAHYVAHGRGSDPGHSKLAVRFSDAETSGMSSVGAYRGLERYRSGTHGPALKLEGLDRTNASAYRRLIVFHTASYFDPENGRFGRSCGCFVVTKGDMTRVYDVIADGGFLYAGPARLHDPSATTAADCNTACGNSCPNAPLMAKATPAPAPRQPAPVLVANAEPAPAPAAPAQQQKPQPAPVVMAALKDEPKPAKAQRADFNAPVPLAKPKLDAAIEVAAALDAPIPKLKPALDSDAIDGEARQAAIALLARRNAPRLVAMANRPAAQPAAAAMADVPVPAAKPDHVHDDAVPQVAAAPLVPDVAPGETPVPSAKPAGLRQTAGLGGRS
ncbi:MAG: murein L,D-transpeptidase catalytic domain family protein [Micropepsaceae bacterium]